MLKLLSTTAAILALASAAGAATAKVDAKAKVKTRVAEQTYCIQFEPDTGSRISRTDCRTKSEWRELGVDVDQLAKK